MNPYPQRTVPSQMQTSRIFDVLDSIKIEYENMIREYNVYKNQRDDYERRLKNQWNEMQNLQNKIFELERTHQLMKQSYEDEIMNLLRNLGKTDTDINKRMPNTGYVLPLLSPNQAPLTNNLKLDNIEQTKMISKQTAPNPNTIQYTNPMDTEERDWSVKYNSSKSYNVNLNHVLDHESVVCCVKFSRNGKYLATGCSKLAQIFDANTGTKLHALKHNSESPEAQQYVRSVCFSPNSEYLASGAEDKKIKVWKIDNESNFKNFEGHEGDIYSMDYSPDGLFLISGSGDKTVKVWSMESNQCLKTLKSPYDESDGITSVAMSPDGRSIVSGSLDKFISLWDFETGRFIHKFEGHSDAVYSVVFSPDGKMVASGSLDKTLKLWDIRDKQSQTLQNHKDFVLSIAYGQDGHYLLSGSKDRTLQFWDLRTNSSEIILQGHKNSVISVAINTNTESPNQCKVASGSGDFKAKIWQFSGLC